MVSSALGGLGRAALDLFGFIGRLSMFFGTTLRVMATSRPFYEGVLEESVRIGVQTAGILACVLFFIGANISLVGYAIFSQFGGQNLIGIYVGMSCVIGLAPPIVGALLCAKPGTEIAATVASMRVKEQIDALEVMAINPFWYLMVPRFLAFLIVTPALVIFADIVSLAGGYVAAVYQLGVAPATFMTDIVRFLTIDDIWKALIRGEIFAVFICLVCCFYGYYSKPGPAGVSRAINLAVVLGSTAINVLNYFLTEIMY